MARLDATVQWFERGEDADSLASVEFADVDGRRVPTLAWVGGAVALTAAAFLGVVLYASHASASRPLMASAKAAAPAPQATPIAETPTTTSPATASPAASAPVAASAPAATTPTPSEPAPAASSSAPVARAAHAAPAAAHHASNAVSPDVLAAEKLLQHGRAGAALVRFQAAITHDGGDRRALRGACMSLAQLNRLDDAARVCRRALERDPGDVEARRALATAYYSGGAYKWSAAEWRRVVEQSPRDVKARRMLRNAEARAQKS